MSEVIKKIFIAILCVVMIFEGFFNTNVLVKAGYNGNLAVPALVLDHTYFNGNYISGSIFAESGQENCTYTLYLNDKVIAENLSAGEFYVDEIPAGEYNVYCKARWNDSYSEATESKQIYVQEAFYFESFSDTTAFEDYHEDLANYIRRAGVRISNVKITASSEKEPNTIGNIADGNQDTFWESSEEQSWLLIDLGKEKAVSEVCILWSADAGAKDYSIMISQDGNKYRTAAYVTDARVCENFGNKDEVSLDDSVNGQYIKINMKSGCSNNGYGICEIALYGPESNYEQETGTETFTTEPTTEEITTVEPTTLEATTIEETSVEPTTIEETSVEPTTVEPTTLEVTTTEPTTVVTTEEQTTSERETTERLPGLEQTSKEVVTKEVLTSKEVTTKKPVQQSTSTKQKAIGKASVKKIDIKKKSAKQIKITLNKTKNVSGYQVAVYQEKKVAKKNKKALITKYVKKLKFKIKSKKLKNKKNLYVRVRAYRLKGKIKKFGVWSNIVRVKQVK